MPERVQLSRRKGWRMPPNTVKVDRSGRWGSNFPVYELNTVPFPMTHGVAFEVGPNSRNVNEPPAWWYEVRPSAPYHFASREEASALAVECFKRFALDRPDYVAAVRRELRGKNLACWCKSGNVCHADVLLEIANAEPQSK